MVIHNFEARQIFYYVILFPPLISDPLLSDREEPKPV